MPVEMYTEDEYDEAKEEAWDMGRESLLEDFEELQDAVSNKVTTSNAYATFLNCFCIEEERFTILEELVEEFNTDPRFLSLLQEKL